MGWEDQPIVQQASTGNWEDQPIVQQAPDTPVNSPGSPPASSDGFLGTLSDIYQHGGERLSTLGDQLKQEFTSGEAVKPIGGGITPPEYSPEDSAMMGYLKAAGRTGAGLYNMATSPAGLATVGSFAVGQPEIGAGLIAAQMAPQAVPMAENTYKASTGQLPPAQSAEAGMNLGMIAAPLLHGTMVPEPAFRPVSPADVVAREFQPVEQPSNAQPITSPASVPQPEVRPSMGETAPLRQQGETAGAQASVQEQGQPNVPEPQAPVIPPEDAKYAGISDEPHISSIANRFVQERVASGDIGEIAPGQGYSTKDLAQRGLQMPPEEINQHISDLMQDTGDPKLQGAAVRAEETRLQQVSNQASKVADANPSDPNARLAADNAFNDLTDFHNGPVAKAKQNFHALGMSMQGEIPVDLSTTNGLREAWFKDVGKKPPSNMESTFRRIARNVTQAAAEDNGAMGRLSREIDRATTGRRLLTADQVRDNIRERMGLEPCR